MKYIFNLTILSFQFDIKPSMSGMGYRIWEMCQALVNIEDLKIKIIAPVCEGLSHKGIVLEVLNINTIEKYISESDIFYVNFGTPPGVISLLKKYKKKIIFDALMTPIETLEYQSFKASSLESQDLTFENTIVNYKHIIKNTDYFITGSYEEKEIMVGQLLMEGRINHKTYKTIDHMIDIIPIGYNRDILKSVSQVEETFSPVKTYVWNGGLWNHYSTKILLKSIKDIAEIDKNIRLEFLYKSNTDTYRNVEKFINNEFLVNSILLDKEKLDYCNRHKKLNSSHAIIVIVDKSIESHTTLRLRIRDVFLYNKPIIATKYGLLGRFIEDNKIGVTVDNTESEIKAAITRLSNDSVFYNKCVEQIKKIKDQFCYENNLFNLVSYIKKRE